MAEPILSARGLTKRYGRVWSTQELALGFMGDVGDLAKLIQAHARVVSNFIQNGYEEVRKNISDLVQLQFNEAKREYNASISLFETIRVVAIDGLVLEVEPEEGGAIDYREMRERRKGSAAVDDDTAPPGAVRACVCSLDAVMRCNGTGAAMRCDGMGCRCDGRRCYACDATRRDATGCDAMRRDAGKSQAFSL